MATAYVQLNPFGAILPASSYAQFDVVAGSNFPVGGLDFDAAATETAYFVFRASQYSSGNLTVAIDWYADTASSGDVVWGAAICVITPDTDSQDIETDTFATQNTVTDSHIGTTGQRLHRAVITVSNLDSLAAEDWVCLQIQRLGADGSDTMAGDATVTLITVSYTAA